MNSDVLRELKKVKFHLRTIGEEIGLERCPIGWLVIKMDWSEEDLDSVINMFYEYRNALKNNEDINLGSLRNALMRLTSNNYDRVKDIIIALHKSERFEVVAVCEKFAEAYSCAEFNEILRMMKEEPLLS